MNKLELILNFEKKKKIENLIDSVIQAKVEHIPKRLQKERVGKIQDLIIDILKIEASPGTKAFITKRMEALGFKRVICMGKYYYRNAKLKEQT